MKNNVIWRGMAICVLLISTLLFVAASHSISQIFEMEVVDYIGFCFYILLFAFWLITLAKTAIHAYSGTLFEGR